MELILRWLLRRAIQRDDKASAERRRRWMLQVRNLTSLLIAGGLVLVWATELKTAAISVVAIVAALVIATKELILCLSGGFLKLSSKSFVPGDHIEVGTVRGEVIDQTLLTTKLMESTSGPNGQRFTGRMITLPNADWSRHEAALQVALDAACLRYIGEARRAVAELSHEEGLAGPNVVPRVHVSIPEPGRVNLTARLPCPVDRKGRVLQSVMRDYLRRAAEIAPPDDQKNAQPDIRQTISNCAITPRADQRNVRSQLEATSRRCTPASKPASSLRWQGTCNRAVLTHSITTIASPAQTMMGGVPAGVSSTSHTAVSSSMSIAGATAQVV